MSKARDELEKAAERFESKCIEIRTEDAMKRFSRREAKRAKPAWQESILSQIKFGGGITMHGPITFKSWT